MVRQTDRQTDLLHVLLHEGRGKIYRSVTAPRQCPLVLLVKAGWKQGTTLDSEDGTHSVSLQQLWACLRLQRTSYTAQRRSASVLTAASYV